MGQVAQLNYALPAAVMPTALRRRDPVIATKAVNAPPNILAEPAGATAMPAPPPAALIPAFIRALPAHTHAAILQLHALPRPSWIAVLAAIAVVTGAVTWLSSPPTSAIDPQAIVETTLTRAREAVADGRYLEPLDRSAFHYFTTVIALDPANEQAHRGLDHIADRYLADARSFIVEGRFAEAVLALDGVRQVRPEHRRLPLLDAQLRRELELQMLVRRERSAVPAAPDPVHAATQDIEDAVRPTVGPASERSVQSGRVEIPASTAPVQPLVASTPTGSALVASAKIAMRLDEPQVTGQLAAVDAPLAASTAALTAAPSSPPAAAERVPSFEPKLRALVQPEYPHDALLRGIEGWVDVSLQISAAGDVIDPRVEASSRRQLFERAALAAVKKWKYEPPPAHLAGAAQRVTVRLKFEMEKRR